MKKKKRIAKKTGNKKSQGAAKKSSKKTAAKATQKKTSKKAKKSTRTYEHHPDHYNTSEAYLIQELNEDLKDAWSKIREFGESLGAQRIYASGRAIMFSKKVCYFFVRPKKSYLEVVIFLQAKRADSDYQSIRPVSKTKFSHTFRLVHSDQVEGELVDAITQAFEETPQS